MTKTPPTTFIPEASGICRLGETLVVASDEDANSLWLVEPDDTSATRVKVKGAKWDDVEDLAAVDDRRFFVTTSHARTKSGKRKPEREQLVLVERKGETLSVVRAWSLREAILQSLEKTIGDEIDFDATEANLPEGGGLNVEGLTYHAGKLFLGLRSPLTQRGDALILRIANAKAMLEGNVAPQFVDVDRIALGKRGVRGLTARDSGILVLGGSPDDSEKPFTLTQWQLASKDLLPVKIAGFDALSRPEGVTVGKDHSLVVVQDFEEPNGQSVVVKLPLP